MNELFAFTITTADQSTAELVKHLCIKLGAGIRSTTIDHTVDIAQVVIDAVTAFTQVTEDTLRGKSRDAEVITARNITIYLLWRNGYTPKKIAMLLCKSTSIIYKSINAHDVAMNYNKYYANKFNLIKSHIDKKLIPCQTPSK